MNEQEFQARWTRFWKVAVAVAMGLAMVANALAGVVFFAPDEEPEIVARSYSTDCYTEQGGSKIVAASGCEIEIQSGATFDLQSGATTDFSGGVDLDGAALLIDADGDTSLQADTNDQVDVAIGGADVVSVTASGLQISGAYLILGEQAVISVTAGAIITPTGGYQPLTSAAEVTASATTAIADGAVNGQIICLVNENASDVIHIPDTANTNLSGQADLGNDDMLCVMWDGADWLEQSQPDN